MFFYFSLFFFEMVLKVSHSNNVKVYHVSGSGQGSLPDWLVKKRKNTLKKDAEWRSRVEIIQDFEFPEASLNIKMTPDESHIIATGVYKPQVRAFDLAELSMKFDRHSDSENVQFEVKVKHFHNEDFIR
jgi:ribosome biogenesis protein ENP2